MRDILIANIVGTGMLADVFFAAFKLTNLLRKVLIEGSFFAAFIPSFSKIKEKYGMEEVKVFSRQMFSIAFYIMILILIIANIFMPEITKFMAPGFAGEKLDMTVSLSYIIFWYFLAISLISILSGVLNGIHKFSYYAVVPIFMNIVMIVFILFFREHFKNMAYCLAWAVVAGGVVQFVFIYLACVYEKFVVGISLPTKKLWNENTKASYKKMLPSIIGGGLTQINTMVDLILGSYIASGVSYLYYVDRIFFLPTSVIGTAISIVILPFISKQIAQNHIQGANHLIDEAIHLSSILVIPASFVLFLNAEMITSVIFARGAFNQNDVYYVSSMLQILAVALPFCVFNKITSTIFFSYSNTSTPMYITFFSVVVNVVISLCLMPYFGIFAITLGTAFSYFLSFLISFIILLVKNMLEIRRETAIFFGKIVIVSFIACAVMQWVAMHSTFGYNILVRDMGTFYKLSYTMFLLCATAFLYFILGLGLNINILRVMVPKKIYTKILDT